MWHSCVWLLTNILIIFFYIFWNLTFSCLVSISIFRKLWQFFNIIIINLTYKNNGIKMSLFALAHDVPPINEFIEIARLINIFFKYAYDRLCGRPISIYFLTIFFCLSYHIRTFFLHVIIYTNEYKTIIFLLSGFKRAYISLSFCWLVNKLVHSNLFSSKLKQIDLFRPS